MKAECTTSNLTYKQSIIVSMHFLRAVLFVSSSVSIARLIWRYNGQQQLAAVKQLAVYISREQEQLAEIEFYIEL
jgi:hypothetical protein